MSSTCSSRDDATRFFLADATAKRATVEAVQVHQAHWFLQNVGLSYSRDLTNDPDFHWRGYVANHSDEWLHTLFADLPPDPQQDVHTTNTIDKFEVRFFSNGYGQLPGGHFEFVAYRSDGKRFRIHPGATAATERNPYLWTGQDTLCRVPKARPPSRGCSAPSQKSQTHSPADDAMGHQFLESCVKEWSERKAAGERPVRFTRNLSFEYTGKWKTFLARNGDSRLLLQRVVAQWWLVWVGRDWQCAGFYLRFKDETKTVYTKNRFSDRWETNDSMVQDIHWRV